MKDEFSQDRVNSSYYISLIWLEKQEKRGHDVPQLHKWRKSVFKPPLHYLSQSKSNFTLNVFRVGRSDEKW